MHHPRSESLASQLIRTLSRPAACAVVLGLFLATIVVVTPPFQGADEDRHFMRAYQISELSLLPTKRDGKVGGTLPESVADAIRALFPGRGHPWDRDLIARELARRSAGSARVFESFPNTALYSPVAYAPQVVGIWIGRLFGLPPVALMWLARLASVVTAVASFLLALRIAPAYRCLIVPLFFLPMFAFQNAIVSVDGLLLGAAAVLFALTMKVVESDGIATAGDRTPLGAIALCTAVLLLTKPTYFPLVMPVGLAVVGDAYRVAGLRGAMRPLLTMAAATVPAAWWSLQVGDLFVGSNPDAVVDPRAQAAFIRVQPVTFLGMCLASCVQQSRHLWEQFVGVLGWLDTPLPRRAIQLLGCGLVAPVLVAGLNVRMRGWFRLTLLLAVVSQVVAICGFIYASWCPVGQEWISGLQGRYFLPLAAFALVAASPDPPAAGRDGRREAVALGLNWIFVVGSVTITMVTLVCRYR